MAKKTDVHRTRAPGARVKKYVITEDGLNAVLSIVEPYILAAGDNVAKLKAIAGAEDHQAIAGQIVYWQHVIACCHWIRAQALTRKKAADRKAAHAAENPPKPRIRKEA